ncbi:sugar ABC transporter substrate-binding protein [Mariniplasma anaerobium]|uniref:Periplasmic binding protein domain-containing protein n=1 Tax=Mariniplasma anaerobium TaxID=2735436 RepID=A0A7U9XV98_9MOLU|nr:substrate-binding domain-containing protein [Mariniplasma anaerobium]BCR36721.1 hypothetical protein MPAN_016140 [Mariniplasma anaerobium]
MRRKGIIFVTLFMLSLALFSCGKEQKEIVALSLTSMDNPLMVAFQESFTARFGEEYDVQVGNANNDPNTQASQIDNFVTMQVKIIFVMPVETSSLVSKLEDARDAGILVFVAGTEPGESARDAVAKMDQFLAGEYEALMVKEWVSENYPDATAGSLEAAVLVSTLNEDSIARSNGLKMAFEPYLKNVDGDYINLAGSVVTEANRIENPVYIPELNKVGEVEASMFQNGQVATENLLTTNPNLKIVLCYDSDAASGASQAIMDSLNGADSSGYATFGVGMFGPEGDTLLASANGEGVLRGCVAFGGGDLVGAMGDIIEDMLSGEDYTVVTWDALATVTSLDGLTLNTVQRASNGIISN